VENFYIPLTALRLGIIPINNQPDTQFLLYIFISILYMFRATLCWSSGVSVVSIQHPVYVTVFRWPSGMQFLPNLHTKQSPTHSDIYRMLYWYNWLYWWSAQGCSKRVENRNKYIEKKLCVRLVIYWNYGWKTYVQWATLNCATKCHFVLWLKALSLCLSICLTDWRNDSSTQYTASWFSEGLFISL
jgi:hypothetical protein